jgi:hypothetical protein
MTAPNHFDKIKLEVLHPLTVVSETNPSQSRGIIVSQQNGYVQKHLQVCDDGTSVGAILGKSVVLAMSLVLAIFCF